MVAPNIEFIGDRLRVMFSDFSAGESYDLFKRVKRLPEYEIVPDVDGMAAGVMAPARFAVLLGVQVPGSRLDPTLLPAWLYDDQAAIISMAVDAKRYAIWSDCGLGKTLDGLEWGRQVTHITHGGRVLFITLNDLVDQWLSEAAQFYGDSLPIIRIDNRAHMKEWCATGCIDGEPTAAKLAVTNYEKFNYDEAAGDGMIVNELRHLAGFALDESSRLKASGGRQKWAIIKSARGIEYKLSLTATPAPNELMEFASQASFLERMRAESIADAAQQIIWTYFTRDPKTHRWTIKQHARAAFFEWMASWSIYVRDPKKYGWRKNWTPPPDPQYFTHEIPMTPEQRELVMDYNADTRNVAEANVGMMFAGELNAIAANRLSQAAKGFIYLKDTDAKKAGDSAKDEPTGDVPTDLIPEAIEPDAGDADKPVPAVKPKSKRIAVPAGDSRLLLGRPVRRIDSKKPAFVADLIIQEVLAGHHVLVWTVFDAETAILQEELVKAAGRAGLSGADRQFVIDTLTGATPKGHPRKEILRRFRERKSDVLISRGSMIGYGQNLQACTSMFFYGFTFSYETFYQAVRRAFRHGQTVSVRVHIPVIRELEGQMYDALIRRGRQHEEAVAEMEANYVSARRSLVPSAGRAA